MKIRIYAPYYPFPISEGAFQTIGDQIRTFLEQGHEVELVLILETAESLQTKIKQASTQERELPFQIVLLTSRTLATSQHQSKSSKRSLRVVQSLFSTLSSPELFYYPPQLANRSFLGEVDLAIYHYGFSYSWLKNGELSGEKKTAVFFHNLESDLYLLRSRMEKNPIKRWIHHLNYKKLKHHERLLANLCHEIWFVSPVDQKAYTQLNGISETHPFRLTSPTYSPDLHRARTQSFQSRLPSHSDTVYLGMVGGLDFQPNHDSAQWIIENLAPLLLEKNFGGKILFVGKNATSDLLKKAKPYPFIEFLGFVPDLETIWNKLSFMLVPHISGSGVRMKLLESLASAIPALANTDAICRIHPGLQKSPFVIHCQSPKQWVQKILEEKPYQTRNSLQQYPLAPELLGKTIYQFLKPGK